jgi:hypothetical protein
MDTEGAEMTFKKGRTYTLPNREVLKFDGMRFIDINRTYSWASDFGCGIGYRPFANGVLFAIAWDIVKGQEKEAKPPVETEYTINDLVECEVKIKKVDLKEFVFDNVQSPETETGLASN